MKKYKVKVFDDRTEYHLNSRRHREDGPAIEYTNGSKEWYLNDELHREDGPAVESSSGTKMWWLNGNLHREDGPAVEWTNDTKEWWLNGKQYSEEDWKKEVAQLNNPCSPVENKVIIIDGK
jgi:hypothetical protein